MDRGNRLKILRMLCGQSQDVLAKNLGLSQGNVATWERKGMFPRDPDIAKRLAESLQAPVGYLAFGDPLIKCAVWEPQPPQSPRHLKLYISEIMSLFPALCMENQIEIGSYYSAENGIIFFLGQKEKPFSYLLIIKSVIAECFMEAMRWAKIEEIDGLVGYPPLTIYFDKFDLEQLEIYFRFFDVQGYSIDTQAIGTALVKARMAQNEKIDIPHSVENTFNIFFSALKEYDFPPDWPDELILRLSPIFNRLNELIVEKPLVGQVLKDDSLAEYIGPMLMGSGLKKRNLDRGSTKGSSIKKRAYVKIRKPLNLLVGMTGFEPAAPAPEAGALPGCATSRRTAFITGSRGFVKGKDETWRLRFSRLRPPTTIFPKINQLVSQRLSITTYP